MAYGEGLSCLNPCDPQTVGAILSGAAGRYARIVDVGCGRGSTLDWLSEHTMFDLYGIEPEYELYTAAQESCPRARIFRARAENLPFYRGAFDAALLECVFSLMQNPEVAADELARILRPEGVILLTDLYTQSDTDFCFRQNPLLRNVYTMQSLESFFLRRGFALDRFIDRTWDMRLMHARMLMDGAVSDYFEEKTRDLLRQARAGYGIWIFKKSDPGLSGQFRQSGGAGDAG